MTIQETLHFDFDLDALEDPWLQRVDLAAFEHLPPQERTRVIIRVLCELVALGEIDSPEPAEGSPTAVTSLGRFRLPLLGIEIGGERKLHNLTGGAGEQSPDPAQRAS